MWRSTPRRVQYSSRSCLAAPLFESTTLSLSSQTLSCEAGRSGTHTARDVPRNSRRRRGLFTGTGEGPKGKIERRALASARSRPSSLRGVLDGLSTEAIGTAANGSSNRPADARHRRPYPRGLSIQVPHEFLAVHERQSLTSSGPGHRPGVRPVCHDRRSPTHAETRNRAPSALAAWRDRNSGSPHA